MEVCGGVVHGPGSSSDFGEDPGLRTALDERIH